MIPVYQDMTVANDGCGNCFNACIASILELTLREVAQIYPNYKGDYYGAWDDWFGKRGLKLELRGSRYRPPQGYAIASGRSSRVYPDGHDKAGQFIHHATVVFDGIVVHDPFPIHGQFDDISSYWVIRPMSAVEHAYFEKEGARCLTGL